MQRRRRRRRARRRRGARHLCPPRQLVDERLKAACAEVTLEPLAGGQREELAADLQQLLVAEEVGAEAEGRSRL